MGGAGEGSPALSADAARALLELARATVDASVRGHPLPGLPELPELAERGGVFVSLHLRGMLRGCIGHIEANLPLAEATRRMAVAAAHDDPRFHPVTPGELEGLDVEVSVLSPPVRVAPEQILPGRDGVIVRRGPRLGLLLPQVAVEQRWDRRAFLRAACAKAVLPPEAWQDPRTEIYAFRATVLPGRTER